MFKWFKSKFKPDEKNDDKKFYTDEGKDSSQGQIDPRTGQDQEEGINDQKVQGPSSYVEDLNPVTHEETDHVDKSINLIDISEEDRNQEYSKEATEKIETGQEETDSDNLAQMTDSELEEGRDVINSYKEDDQKDQGFFKRLFSGLEKTRNSFTDKIAQVLGSYVTIDDEMYEDLEDILITADVGVNTTILLIDNLRKTIKEEKINDPARVPELLAAEARKILENSNKGEFRPEISPTILLVVGVNGVGKTTTIGKLAFKYKSQGKRVLLVAADTFRAAATEQLQEWSNRAGVEIIYQKEGADPAAVVYDAIQAAKARKADLVLCDTAGRLHNKANLMNELEKIYSIIDKNYPEANKESLIVLDATTGQNAISQAKEFKEVANVTGVAVTKLDGTAKGGIILPLINELQLPVAYIGVGEQIEDLQEFNSDDFIESIFNQ